MKCLDYLQKHLHQIIVVVSKGVEVVWIPRWYWENAIRRQDELERRVKRLELIFLQEAENKIASLSNKEAGKEYKDGYLTIEEIINQGIQTR